MVGNPPHLIRLRDGRLAVTYGYRSPPYGIRARLSADEGQTWSREISRRIRCGTVGGFLAEASQPAWSGDLLPVANTFVLAIKIVYDARLREMLTCLKCPARDS